MAQRLVRAKRKIRQARIAFGVPRGEELTRRLGPVLRVVYLVFTQGHRAARGPGLIRGELCDQAIRLARALAALLPGEPEAAGLLALLLLTDARRAARLDRGGELVPLAGQDRRRWDRDLIVEGEALLTRALTAGRPGPYQLHAAIAACHSVRRRKTGLAADRPLVRGAGPVRADAGDRGQPGGGGGDGRAARRGPGHPGRAGAPGWPAGRSSTSPGPSCCGSLDRPGEARRGVPGRTAAGTGPPRADPHQTPPGRAVTGAVGGPGGVRAGERYSAAIAARTSSRAARRAGQVAAASPSTADRPGRPPGWERHDVGDPLLAQRGRQGHARGRCRSRSR